jgi:hypothetical protein
MSFPTLWNTLAILPAVKAPATRTRIPETSADLDPHLPSWERHPAERISRGAGHLDTAWIHSHLP